MSLDPTDSEIRAQQAKEDRQRRAVASDLRWVMSDKRGRRVVARILEKAGVYRSSFTGNSETFFREGMRNLGLMIISDIEDHAPDAYVLMLQERKQNDN